MNQALRKNLNIIVPLTIAGYVGYTTYKKTNDPKKTAIATAVLLIVIYAITSAITGGIKAAQDTKIISTVPPDPNYNPAPLANALYKDIYEIFGFRDKQYYYDLVGLTDAQFVAVCTYWNQNYYSKDNETLKQAINGEVLGIELASTLKTLNARFTNLKIN
jgi:hypothetical protein